MLASLAQQLIADFVAELTRVIEFPEPVVEFGSLQVEPDQPNDLRSLFGNASFIGTDMRPGPGVDRVEDLRCLSYADGEIGTALCLDTLEHCEDPMTACREFHRVLRDGGVCVISSVMFFPVHGYPQDYWRFTPEGFRLLLAGFEEVWVAGVGHSLLPTQVVGVGVKGGELGLSRKRFAALSEAQEWWDRCEGRVSFDIVQVPLGQLARALARQLPRVIAQRVSARVTGS